MSSNYEAVAVIAGAGAAGLNCARVLQKHGVRTRIHEASDGVGGRMRTDQVDGFLLDRGFQVFQTAYPEAQAALDYNQLALQELTPGALVRKEGKWVRMVDPRRAPRHLLSTVFNSIGNLSDRFRLWRLIRDM